MQGARGEERTLPATPALGKGTARQARNQGAPPTSAVSPSAQRGRQRREVTGHGRGALGGKSPRMPGAAPAAPWVALVPAGLTRPAAPRGPARCLGGSRGRRIPDPPDGGKVGTTGSSEPGRRSLIPVGYRNEKPAAWPLGGNRRTWGEGVGAAMRPL